MPVEGDRLLSAIPGRQDTRRRGPQYVFRAPDTQLFVTGVTGVGKSTIAPQVASSIEGCTVQSMDIFRLIAQQVDSEKPLEQRNPFVLKGSCDSYVFVGDGSYSKASLVQGFNEYSAAVSSYLKGVVPNLEAQGTSNVVFEGVQLTPHVVSPYLEGSHNRLVIITADEKRISQNIAKVVKNDPELQVRYPVDRILLIQEEILRQSADLGPESVIYVRNTAEPETATASIMSQLLAAQVIENKSLK